LDDPRILLSIASLEYEEYEEKWLVVLAIAATCRGAIGRKACQSPAVLVADVDFQVAMQFSSDLKLSNQFEIFIGILPAISAMASL
jgi:hypothetical protein